MRKAVISLVVVACLGLTACGNQSKSSQTNHSSEASSLKKENSQLKEKIAKKKHSSSKQSSSSTANNGNTATAQTQTSSVNQAPSNVQDVHPRLADGTDVYSLPLSYPRNPDSYKQGWLMDIAADPQYHNPDGSMNQQGEALVESIENTFHQPQ